MKKLFLQLCFFMTLAPVVQAQILVNGQTRFGNEWIDHEKTYLKIKVTEDGWYRLTGAQLQSAGFSIERPASELQLWWMGEAVPLVRSTNAVMTGGDYIAFYGRRNRSELDRHLFEEPERDMLNPHYSMFSDTSAYFLTWGQTGSPDYAQLDNDLSNPPPKEEWYRHTERKVFNDAAYYKKYDSENLVAFSDYDNGEGFASTARPNHNITFNPDPAATTDEDARLYLHVFSERTANELTIAFNGKEYVRKNISAPTHFIKEEISLPLNELTPNSSLNIRDERQNRLQYALAFAELTYPRPFDAGGAAFFAFDLPAGPERYFEIDNFDGSGGNVWVYDLDHQQKIKAALEGSTARFILPATGSATRLLLINEQTGFREVNELSVAPFDPLKTDNETQFLIITHSGLFSGSGGADPVQEYAAYRSSEAGGGYRTRVLTVDQLYDQFAYGIFNHPLGIQNFGQYAAQNWPDLKYVLLLGHGYSYVFNRKGSAGLAQNHFVPTFGYPGSDNMMLAPPGSITPSFAVGRVAANTAAEVSAYLAKLKKYEAQLARANSLEDRLWRKRVLHIVGGSNAEQQQEFKFYLDNMGGALTSNGFGAFLNTVSKDNDEAVQQSTSQRVVQAVNEGVAIKAFLGHGGVTNTDFGLDNPLLFDNEERYPLIFSLGCLTGFLFDQQKSLSESFVLAPERGGIGYIASGGFAYAYSLDILTEDFYRLLGTEEYYTASVGEIVRRMRQNAEQEADIWTFRLAEQLTYHGDPALKMNLYKGPDYTIDIESVRISPSQLTTRQDSFHLRFDILNLGFNQVDTFAIQFKRTFPDGTVTSFKDTIGVGVGKNKMYYRFKLGDDNLEGEHRLEILLDADNAIAELPSAYGENNNELIDNNGRKGISFFVQQNAIIPIRPLDFSIVNEENPRLMASASTLKQDERQYLFELDTTPDFNSSLKKTHQLRSSGGIIEWTPQLDWKEGQVYHWRVRELDLGEERWVGRSFIYLEGSPDGWNQSQYYQLASDSLFNLTRKKAEQKLEYTKGFLSVVGEAKSFDVNTNNDYSKFNYDGPRQYWGAHWRGVDRVNKSHIFIAVFDPLTGEMWRNPREGKYGSINGRYDNYFGFVYSILSPEERNNAVTFINDIIPEGHYVLFLTSQEYGSSLEVEEWAADSLEYGANLFTALEAQGARQVRLLERLGSYPYAFAFIKGENALSEMLVTNINEDATVSFELPFLKENGCLTTPLIGPAGNWSSLDWQPQLPAGQNDEYSLTIFKWNAARTQADTVGILTEGGPIGLEQIDPQMHPYLQLRYCSKDTEEQTFTSPAFLRVLYEGVPDLVLAPGSNYRFRSDTLPQGQPLELVAELVNFGGDVQDSIDVRFSLRSAGNQSNEAVQKLGPMEAGTSQPLTFDFETSELSGAQELAVEVNPDRKILEEEYANNIGVLPFEVLPDTENPILDVTFDGRHILNGELVSARPLISISVTDENDYLVIRDTTAMQIWLDRPDGATRPFYFDDPRLQFYPAADAKNNRARVEFEPQLELDGEYTLRVRASDASGNIAGASAYEVSFQVITESQISNVLPYPNPFTTSCRFVYTLTGDREPADFKIQIMTVSGRIVREITKLEFGRLRVGTHQSDFVWDGADEFGDPLANGVYLYRVVAKDMEGEELKHYENSSVDGYFKNDIGKIVILR